MTTVDAGAVADARLLMYARDLFNERTVVTSSDWWNNNVPKRKEDVSTRTTLPSGTRTLNFSVRICESDATDDSDASIVGGPQLETGEGGQCTFPLEGTFEISNVSQIRPVLVLLSISPFHWRFLDQRKS